MASEAVSAKPCDCKPTCQERESVAAVIRDEIAYQSKKKPSPEVAYVITILKQVLDGIEGGYGTGVGVRER